MRCSKPTDICVSEVLPKSRQATTCRGSLAAARKRAEGALASIGKPDFHAHLRSRKAVLQAQLRGVSKMLSLLPDDSDLRAVFFR